MLLTDDTVSLEVDAREGCAADGCSTVSLLSPHLFIFISADSLSPVFLGITSLLCKPFLIVLSVINLHRTDSILLYPAHIFFHLPPHLSPSSIALPRRMLKSQWTGNKNMNSTSESRVSYAVRLTGLPLIFPPPTLSNGLILASSCSHV